MPFISGALLKASFICADIVSLTSTRSLKEQLMEGYGGGFEIHSWSVLPQGSGNTCISISFPCATQSCKSPYSILFCLFWFFCFLVYFFLGGGGRGVCKCCCEMMWICTDLLESIVLIARNGDQQYLGGSCNGCSSEGLRENLWQERTDSCCMYLLESFGCIL